MLEIFIGDRKIIIKFKKLLLYIVLISSIFCNRIANCYANSNLNFDVTEDTSSIHLFNNALKSLGQDSLKVCFDRLDTIIKNYPDYLPAYEIIVIVFHRKEEGDKLEFYFNELLKEADQQCGAFLGLGCHYYLNKNYEQAIEYFKKSIHQNNNFYLPYSKLVDSYKSINKLSEAESYLNGLCSKTSSNAALFCGFGYLHMVLRNWEKSLQYLDKAIMYDKESIEAYKLKANVLFNNGNYKEAEKSLQKAMDLCQKKSHKGEKAIILNNFGTMKFNQGRIYSADYYFQEALNLYKMIGFYNPLYTVQMNLGMVKNYSGNYDKALELLKGCLSYFKMEEDSTHLSACLGHIGWVYKNKTNYDSALVYFKPGAAIAEQIGDFRFAAYWNRFIGLIHQETGGLLEALESYHRALRFSRKFKDRAEQARNIAAIGKIYYKIGKVDSSQIYFQKALNIHRRTGDKIFEAHTLADLAMVRNHIGNYSKGLEFYEKAYSIAKENNDITSQCRFLENIGAAYSHFSDYRSSVEYYDKALRIAQEYKMASNQIRLLSNLGNIYLYMQKPDSALPFLRKSFDIAESTDSKTREVSIFFEIGTAYVMKHEYQKALVYYNSALKLAKRTDQQVLLPEILLNLGYVNKKLDNYKIAKNYYHQALKLATHMNSVWNIIDIYKRLGELYFVQDSLSLAVSHLEKSIVTIEGIRSKISGQGFKISYFESKIDIYNLLIHNLVTLYKKDLDRQHLYDAFAYSERSKSRAMLDMLNQNKDIFLGGMSVELLAEWKKAEESLENVQSELSILTPQMDQKSSIIDSLKAELKQAKYSYEKIRNKVDRLRPAYSTLSKETQPITLKEIKKRVLKSNQTLLEYTIGEHYSYVFVLHEDSLYVTDIPVTQSSLKQMLTNMNQQFGIVHDQFDIEFDLELAYKLYLQLIQPVEKYINSSDALLIVPDNILFYLPFELLVIAYDKNRSNESVWYSKYRDAIFLIEKYPISYSNSVSMLDPHLYKNKIKNSRDSLLAIGCPFYLKETSDNYALRSSERLQFKPIPFSKDEIFSIGTKFKNARIIYDKEATEDMVKRIASNYRFLHFSTHGLIDEYQPLYSGLVFSQDNDPSEDGFLQTYEIFNLDLNAELVTLSACGTGLGILKKGEGIIGLSRAFQYAGSKSLVVSLWNVSDESTALLMTHFYKNLKQGMNKAKALQKAKLTLMNSVSNQGEIQISYAHPFFWAPFILIGDSQEIYESQSEYTQLYWCILVVGIIGVFIISMRLIQRKIKYKAKGT